MVVGSYSSSRANSTAAILYPTSLAFGLWWPVNQHDALARHCVCPRTPTFVFHTFPTILRPLVRVSHRRGPRVERCRAGTWTSTASFSFGRGPALTSFAPRNNMGEEGTFIATRLQPLVGSTRKYSPGQSPYGDRPPWGLCGPFAYTSLIFAAAFRYHPPCWVFAPAAEGSPKRWLLSIFDPLFVHTILGVITLRSRAEPRPRRRQADTFSCASTTAMRRTTTRPIG